MEIKKTVRVSYGSNDTWLYSMKRIQDAKVSKSERHNKFVLAHSPLDSQWIDKEKVCAELQDTGNGFEIKIVDGPTISLDYLQVEHLQLLLREACIGEKFQVFVKDIK